MTSLSRLWFALPPNDGALVAGVLNELAGRPLAALLHEADDASRRMASELVARGAPQPERAISASLADLDRLAAAHADLEFAVVAGPRLLSEAISAALGLPAGEVRQILPRAGSLHGFHWPTGQDALARPELIGLDLDWFPPWRSGQPRPRFPGGPGVAGAARR